MTSSLPTLRADPSKATQLGGDYAPRVAALPHSSGSMHDHDMLAEALVEYDRALPGFRGVERARLAMFGALCGWTEERGDLVVWSRRRVGHYRDLICGSGREIDQAARDLETSVLAILLGEEPGVVA